MIFLSGCTSPSYERALIDMGVGLLLQPYTYSPRRVEPFPFWAADNGCWRKNWSPEYWRMWLKRLRCRDRCMFVLVPDVPFDHAGTMERWELYHRSAARAGMPLAFAVQDGVTEDEVPWDDVGTIFIAGTTEWKTGRGAFDAACWARARGKSVHYGRVNSWARLDIASVLGDSSDGTFMKHGPPDEMVARMKVWLDNNDPRLFQKASYP